MTENEDDCKEKLSLKMERRKVGDQEGRNTGMKERQK